MTRRPADYTAQLQADQERRRLRDEQRRDDKRRKKLHDRQATAFGTVVLEILGHELDIDQLAGALLEVRQRAGANPATDPDLVPDLRPNLMEVWRQRGRAFFRLPANGREPSNGSEPAAASQQQPATTAHGHHDASHPAMLPPSQQDRAETLRRELRICSTAWLRIGQAQVRRQRHEAVTATRDWRQLRRQRTRTLIEYGGLLVKATLPQVLEDDRATMLGALLHLRDLLAGLGEDNPDHLKTRWRRRGLRAFDADAANRKEGNREGGATEGDTPIGRPIGGPVAAG